MFKNHRDKLLKEAFEKVGQDISFLQSEISYLRQEIQEIKSILWQLSSSLETFKQQEKKSLDIPKGLQDFLKSNGFKILYDGDKKYY